MLHTTSRPLGASVLVVAAASVGGLVACDVLSFHGPRATTPLDPIPAEYPAWWSLLERCSGLEGDLEAIEFRLATEVTALEHGAVASGDFNPRALRIVLLDGSQHDGFLVRHELLHALLSGERIYDHPAAYYEKRCGGVVSCSGPCREEVGREPPPSAAQLEPSDARLTVELFPAEMSVSPRTTACSTIVVHVRNAGTGPASLAVVDGAGLGFTIDGSHGEAGGGPRPPRDRVILDPGESRRLAFDCPASVDALTPGTYLVRGTWRGLESEAVRLTVVP